MNPQKIQNNPYGYKVCYREKRSKDFIRILITSTYKEAVKVKKTYLLAPQIAEMKALDRPIWDIFPITQKEVKAGI